MTLETFFEKFAQFADAPSAVDKMRELVLNFAVTGRLSERQTGDAPVSELIGSLSAAKERRLNKRRKTAEVVGVAPVEIDRPVVVPDHWAWIPLNEIGALSGGMTPSKAKSVFWDGDVNWFSSKDIKPDELTESELKITREGMESTGLQLYSPGCLVMVARSGILKHTFPVSILRVEGTVNQDLKVFSPFIDGLDRYLQIMLRGLNGFIITSLVKTGMTVQSLKFEEFALQPFPLPPLAEQKRIVAKVDELMALCDRLEAQQQERETRHAALARASLARFADAPTVESLRYLFHPAYPTPPADLRKSILTLAVQGKLVPQDPNDEPAEVTFGKLAVAAIEANEDGLPTHWLRVPLGKMGEWRGGGTPSKSRPEFWKGDLPWVSPKDMKVLHISDAQDHISKAAVEGSSVRLIPPGSLLMVVRGMILARTFPVALTTREVTINQDMKALLPSEPRLTNYLLVALRAFEPEVLAAIEHSSHGTCKLKTEFLQNFVIPIPPLAEQRRIVAKVDQLMALVDQLETQLAASRTAAAKLLDALVADLTAPRPDSEAEVIDLHSSPEFVRSVLAAQIVDQMHHHATFGRVKLQKVIYLAEYIAELPEIDSRPTRFANGPHDPELLAGVEHKMADSEWYATEHRENGGYVYRPLAHAGHQQATFARLWPTKSKIIQSLITEMLTWKTERCERFATAYAAWNDLIIWGEKVTDSAILCEVLERWHSHKLEIPRSSWLETLQWMRDHNYIPTGFGHATTIRRQAELSL